MKKWLLSAFLFLAGLAQSHGQLVAHPTFSPAGGTITGAVNVTMTTTTSGATIFYCYSGSAITSCTGSVTTYTGPVYVNPSTIEYLCAYGTKTGYTTSSTFCQTYTKSSGSTVATPSISPVSGSYTMPQTITITVATSGATIVYGTTTPSGACTPSTTYTGPFSISPSTSETVCAQATKTGLTDSAVTSNVYGTGNFATGDTIARTEPVFPLTTTCDIYHATVYQALTNTVNLDPWNPTIGTSGVLTSTGGTSYEPSTASGSYTAAETNDTGLQAMVSATTKPCVEVELGTSGQDALVLNHGFTPQTSSGNGIILIVDGGVKIYLSRNQSDFGGSCGNWATWPAVLNCPHWIATVTADNVGIYGYGVFDARAWSRYTSSADCPSGYSPCSPATLKVLSYCLHEVGSSYPRVWPHSGTAQIPCPTGTTTSDSNNVANGSNMFESTGANNTTLYKISFLNSRQFNINWVGPANNFLGWGIKYIAPGETSNTDGFDPAKGDTNFSLYYSYCSVGDNCVSIKTNTSNSAGTQSANGTFSHDQETAGIAWTIGYNSTATSGIGVQNILFDTLVMNGGYRVNSDQQKGWGIAGLQGEGGHVDKVTFQHICATNETVSAYYTGSSGADEMTNINEYDTHILTGSLTGNSGELVYAGSDSSHLLDITLDSIIADGGLTHDNNNSNITIGPDGVGTNVYNTLTGTNVTTSPNSIPAPTSTPVSCVMHNPVQAGDTWKPLIGELWFSSGSNNNLQTLSPAAPATYKLNATLMPTQAFPSTKEALFLNQTGTQGNPVAKIEFLDNGTPIAACSGSNAVQLIHGDMYAACSLTGVTAGTHVYTARYNASGTDSNYPTNFVWGNPGTGNVLIANVSGSSPTTVTPQGSLIQVGP